MELLLLAVAHMLITITVFLGLTTDLGLQVRRLDLAMVGDASCHLLLLSRGCRLRL